MKNALKLLLSVVVMLFSFTPFTALAYTITTNSGTNAVENMGNVTVDQVADPITTIGAGTINTIRVALRIATGAPVDSVKISIQADSAGNPSDVDLTSGTIAASSLTSSIAYYDIALSQISLTAATNYWVVFGRTGATSNTAFYNTGGLTSPITNKVHLLGVWSTGDGQDGITLEVTPAAAPPNNVGNVVIYGDW